MEKIDVISIPFYKFKAESSLIKQVYDDVIKLNFEIENLDQNSFVYPNFYHEKLFSFFNDSINEFKNHIFKENLNFPIVDCWVNKYGRMNKLRKHKHSNSIICGLYYVTGHTNKQTSTIFEAENPWTFVNPNISSINLSVNNQNFMQSLKGEILPEEGTLVLFPPGLFHYMAPITKSNEFKYTIAFNTFVDGEISDSNSQILSIKSVSMQERFNK